MAPSATDSRRPRPRRRLLLVAGLGLCLIVVAAGVTLLTRTGARTSTHSPTPSSPHHGNRPATSVPPSAPTTTQTTHPAGPGFVAGKVTAIGDSVMLDYQDPLRTSVPGIEIDAAVSRQWSDGESLLQSLKSQGALGADVVVALGTNGPITQSDFDSMMSVLQGASRVVFVNVHVDKPWRDPNNAVLASGVARYPGVALADWASLAAQHPEWFGADGTHLAIDGPGAAALSSLVASTLDER